MTICKAGVPSASLCDRPVPDSVALVHLGTREPAEERPGLIPLMGVDTDGGKRWARCCAAAATSCCRPNAWRSCTSRAAAAIKRRCFSPTLILLFAFMNATNARAHMSRALVAVFAKYRFLDTVFPSNRAAPGITALIILRSLRALAAAAVADLAFAVARFRAKPARAYAARLCGVVNTDFVPTTAPTS